MKKIVVFENKELMKKIQNESHTDLIFVHSNSIKQKDFLKILKKKRAKFGMLVDKNNSVNIAVEKLGSWRTISKITLDMLVMEELNLKPAEPSYFSNKIPFGKKTNLIKFGEFGINYSNELINEVLLKKIVFFNRDDLILLIKKFESKWGNYKFSFKKVKYSNAIGLENFKNSLKNEIVLKGLRKPSEVVIKEEELNFKMDIALISIKIKKDDILIYSIVNSDNEIDNHYFNKSLLNNMANHFLNFTTDSRKKIKKKDIFISLTGFIVFIVLSYYTFTHILNPKDIGDSFLIVFSLNTYSYPWIYLLWFNFFISFFLSFIIMYLMSYMVNRRKPSFNNVLNFFIAGQIRAALVILTGQEILAMFIWGFYLVKKNEIRVSTLVGTIAFIQILRGFVTIFIGIPFMIIGQIYLSNVIGQVGGQTVSSWIFYTLSWGGILWFLVDKMIRGGVVYIPPVHYFYNKIYTWIVLFKKNPNVFDDLQHREMGLQNLKTSTSSLMLNWERLFRVSATIIIVIFIETFEMMYIFNIVEQSMPNTIIHYNFLQLSGARYMISQINHFPIINIMPGNGIGPIEEFMSNIFQYIYLFSHNLVNNDSNKIVADSFASQTTFMTRFFNSYFKGILHLAITMYIIAKIICRRKI